MLGLALNITRKNSKSISQQLQRLMTCARVSDGFKCQKALKNLPLGTEVTCAFNNSVKSSSSDATAMISVRKAKLLNVFG